MTPLDCAGCRKCCLGDTVFLTPHDDPFAYETEVIPGHGVALAKRDGHCVYLGKTGCMIHGRQPAPCRAYDCRKHAEAAALDAKIADRGAARGGADSALAEGLRRLSAQRRLTVREDLLRTRHGWTL